MRLPLRERWLLADARRKAGLAQINHGWGSYAEQLPLLGSLVERSADDFAFLREELIAQLSDRSRLEAFHAQVGDFRARLAADRSHAARHEEAMAAMGRWLGAYFDDAGYQGWMFYPELFKAMVLTAFPPIDTVSPERKSPTEMYSGTPDGTNASAARRPRRRAPERQ